ncbi:MAG: ubiquinone/menaquinone biosynthesis methyltransferase [Candidatus Micrarchaeales archaeon]|nr:ubiquinone/menaquinone biosynthesis methyltransferase [Candidatus Micrarchaeales archaeon]
MSDENKRMFSLIAKNYDKTNRLISLGADSGWRKVAAKECVTNKKAVRVLDVATGTGELAIAIARQMAKEDKEAYILGLDFNKDMLKIAREKIAKKGMKNIEFAMGDALALDLGSNEFDIVTSGFALRNFDDLQQFIRESYRVLSPGGKIVFLDVAKPDSIFNKIFEKYYFNIVPLMGAKYSKDAYVHLITTAWRFDKGKLPQMAKSVGFINPKIKNLTFGTAFIFTARKPKRAKR